MKISLIHPSRGRANQAAATFRFWMSRATEHADIQHILSLDKDDQQLQQYRKNFQVQAMAGHDITILVNDNDCIVQATNRAIEHVKGDIVIYLSDDFQCPDWWDKHVEASYLKVGQPELWLVRVDDCLQKLHADVLTIPIMTKKLMDHLGYFWNPIYKSMFVDQDLFYTCKNNGWLYFEPDLKFPHLHYCNGKAAHDETYKRSSANWQSGQETYTRRKRENFPLCK